MKAPPEGLVFGWYVFGGLIWEVFGCLGLNLGGSSKWGRGN